MKPKNVWIIDNAFYMPQLARWRRIWLYIPEDYAVSGKRYPVLYMHDGQNLFEQWSAFGEEWEVDETIDAMKEKCLVVGIDNGLQYRLQEYNIHDHAENGKGQGKQYIEFIVQTLKPYIDTTYRTLSGKEHTYIAGSSMGGLISFYAGLLYPDTFGKTGVFSPSFWLHGDIIEDMTTAFKPANENQRWYFYAGEREGGEMAENTRRIAKALRGKGLVVKENYFQDGDHSEKDWREQFPDFYSWLLS
jgi:predicted alpha/beta superfamily hydrolase